MDVIAGVIIIVIFALFANYVLFEESVSKVAYACPINECGAEWTWFNNTIDGDWDTYGFGNSQTAYLILNYTKPKNIKNNTQIWQIKYSYVTEPTMINLTIPNECVNADKKIMQLSLGSRKSRPPNNNGIYMYCNNGSNNLLIHHVNWLAINPSWLPLVYGEDVIWNTTER